MTCDYHPVSSDSSDVSVSPASRVLKAVSLRPRSREVAELRHEQNGWALPRSRDVRERVPPSACHPWHANQYRSRPGADAHAGLGNAVGLQPPARNRLARRDEQSLILQRARRALDWQAIAVDEITAPRLED